ncbi:MAG TPA: hypothetical protein VI298_01665 [Geobacteraceae bacterium]
MAKIRLTVKISPADSVPHSFTLRDREFSVRAVLDRWEGADHAYYKLIADDGNLYVIRRDREDNEWEMVLMEAAGNGRSG